MKNINWKVRFKHKPFLVALFSALLMLGAQVGEMLGLDTTIINEQLTTVFNSVLGILVILGVVIDPVTPGLEDSERAMKYEEPGK